MSKEVVDRIGAGAPKHRIPGGRDREVPVDWLANKIIYNIQHGSGWSINGCNFRIDGGEQ